MAVRDGKINLSHISGCFEPNPLVKPGQYRSPQYTPHVLGTDITYGPHSSVGSTLYNRNF